MSPLPDVPGVSRRPGKGGAASPNLLLPPIQPQLGGDSWCWQDTFVLCTNTKNYVECGFQKSAFKASDILSPTAGKITTAWPREEVGSGPQRMFCIIVYPRLKH